MTRKRKVSPFKVTFLCSKLVAVGEDWSLSVAVLHQGAADGFADPNAQRLVFEGIKIALVGYASGA